ncbi:hypothetical protein EXIGLDRAFT_765107 [Exidia glandulosa HHB12029]|uniref:Uncharacterized protein n=1 Tax=Exidia glandulosa HHB12029 TaxID=1314781 RepID=A0A165KR34_EXIGL|nr:hypothetical protein EXIGLDRAFT_765107 [Exidia glandulosa HHB12029]
MSWRTPFSYISQATGLATRAGRMLIPTATTMTASVTIETTELVNVARREYEPVAPIPPFDDQHTAYPPTRVPPAFRSSQHHKVIPPVLPVASRKVRSTASDADSGYASASFDSSDDECTTSSLDGMEHKHEHAHARLPRTFRSPSPATSESSMRCLPVSSPRPYDPEDSEDNYTMPVEQMQYAGKHVDAAATHLPAGQGGVAPVASSSFSVHPLEEHVKMEEVALVTPAFSRATRAAAQDAPLKRIPALALPVRLPAPAAVVMTRVHAVAHNTTDTTAPRAAVAPTRLRPRYPLPPPMTGKRTHDGVEEPEQEHEQDRRKKARTGHGEKPQRPNKQARRLARNVAFDSLAFVARLEISGSSTSTLRVAVDGHTFVQCVPDVLARLGGTKTKALVLRDTVPDQALDGLEKSGLDAEELIVVVSGRPACDTPLWQRTHLVLALQSLPRVVFVDSSAEEGMRPGVPWQHLVSFLGGSMQEAHGARSKPEVDCAKITILGARMHAEELSAVGVSVIV